jgi:UrcA family protein
MIKLSVALATIGLLAAPVAASADTPREKVAVRVSTAGLNLATPEGVAALRARTARAINEACSNSDRTGTSLSPDWQCRNELGSNADYQVAQLQLNAGRLASN